MSQSASPPTPPSGLPRGTPTFTASLQALARDIKLSHTIFALPFALLSAFVAANKTPATGQLLLVLACMVTARTLGMSANRLLDARLDALNPRTQSRAIPAGRLTRRFVLGSIITCALLFELACLGFYFFYSNPIPAIAGPLVLLFLSAYPLLKRFTALCHYYLGAALALAPICAHFAITSQFSWTPFVLACGVLLWTAGFDILYACQDYESDLATGTFSVPAVIGVRPAFWIARLSHTGAAIALLFVPFFAAPLGTLYLAAAAIACLLLIIEHSIISPSDLSRLNLAFFTLNGCISLLLGTAGIIDVLT